MDRVSATSSIRPTRSTPARAKMTASRSSWVRPIRVSMLPRSGTISKSLRKAASWAMRRGAPVPTRAPEGSSARVLPLAEINTSWALTRGGTAKRKRSSGAVGKSLKEWIAISHSPAANAVRRVCVNTPTPTLVTGMFAAWLASPGVWIMCSSASYPASIKLSRTWPACVIASVDPRVPMRIMCHPAHSYP